MSRIESNISRSEELPKKSLKCGQAADSRHRLKLRGKGNPPKKRQAPVASIGKLSLQYTDHSFLCN